MPIVSVVWEDAEGAQRSVPWYVDESVNTIAGMQAAITDMAGKLNTVSGCKVAAATATFNFTVPAGTADAGYRNDAGAYMSFWNAASPTPRAFSYYIPGFLLTKVSNGFVEEGDADVIALRDAILGGFDLGNAPIRDDNGLDLVAYYRGKLNRRK